VDIDVECHTFINSVRVVKLNVLDVTADSVKKIFSELFRNNFPIYMTSCYKNRLITSGTKPSLHAYGAAIDINEHMNPYYNVLKGASSIVPKRYVDRVKDNEEITRLFSVIKDLIDENEVKAIVGAITQEADSDDWFVNREIHRKGMLTRKEAGIFEKHGFTVWGGDWKQPMDFMHFQIPRKLAEVLASNTKEEGEIIWKNHLLLNEWHLRLKDKLAVISKEKADEIWKDHLEKCQSDGGYLAAANTNEAASICLKDTKYKYDNIIVKLRKRSLHKNKAVPSKRRRHK